MFLNISIKSKEKILVLLIVIIIVTTSASILLMIINIEKIEDKESLKEQVDLTFDSYYTSYDMTVISNKNINTYNVKEWHKQGTISKLEYLDYMKNIVTITLQDNVCYIKNNSNTAKLVVNNMVDNKNISSLSTYGYLYSTVKNSNNTGCKCRVQEYVKDKEVTISINLDSECLCKCSKFASLLQILKLELTLIDGVPKNYTIYDKNKKEYICIVYNVYEKTL